MKIAFKAVFFILCLNFATVFVQDPTLNIPPYTTPITPLNTTAATNATDLGNLISAGDTANPIFYDLQVALWGLWKIAETVVVGFPSAMAALGVPTVLSTALYGIFVVVWAVLIIEIRSGRDITDA